MDLKEWIRRVINFVEWYFLRECEFNKVVNLKMEFNFKVMILKEWIRRVINFVEWYFLRECEFNKVMNLKIKVMNLNMEFVEW